MSTHVLSDPNTHAALVTGTSAASSILFWGLKVSDLGVMVSSFAAVLGMFIQLCVFLETRRHNRVREENRADTPDPDEDA